MSMTTYVIGFKPTDEKYLQMKKIYEACEQLKMPIPREVDIYFEGRSPDNTGIRVDDIKYSEWCDSNSSSGIEVNIDELPADVKIIRFINSW